MALSIQRQDSYSRGQLLLRTFFGWLYIALPHYFLIFFVSIWAAILGFLAWWAVLFTGKYPESWFSFQTGLIAWTNRVAASLGNLTDEYPSFGTSGTAQTVQVVLDRPASLSRGLLILRLLFGWLYLFIPHVVALFFRIIGAAVVAFLAWWAILFTGSFPVGFHSYLSGTQRWLFRVGAYASFLTDTYPPFSGKP